VRAALALIAALAAGPGAAQPEGFGAAMDEALAAGGETAPFLRCAGLFRAFHLLLGAETETGAAALEAELDMAVASSRLREAETGAPTEAVMTEIAPLIAAAAELYLQRMVANAAETGQEMDAGLGDALGACAVLHGQILGTGTGRAE
jgi:hypothetical protein